MIKFPIYFCLEYHLQTHRIKTCFLKCKRTYMIIINVVWLPNGVLKFGSSGKKNAFTFQNDINLITTNLLCSDSWINVKTETKQKIVSPNSQIDELVKVIIYDLRYELFFKCFTFTLIQNITLTLINFLASFDVRSFFCVFFIVY